MLLKKLPKAVLGERLRNCVCRDITGLMNLEVDNGVGIHGIVTICWMDFRQVVSLEDCGSVR